MLAQIEKQIEALSAAEQRVASWIVGHPRQAAEATLAEVARGSEVSEPTVVRFCRSIGLAGFRELTRRLTAALSQPVGYLHQDVLHDDSCLEAASKVFDAAIRALLDARASLAQQPFEHGASLLADARQIVFVGLGASSIVARDAAHKFFRLGIPCSAQSDVPTLLQLASIAGPGDALLFISTRGNRSSMVEAATAASTRGARVITLTRPDSELAAAGKLLFPCDPAEDTSIFTPMSSRLAQLATLDALMVTLALALGETATARLRSSKIALS